MSETPLEVDEGVSHTQAMVEEQEYLDNKIVLVNTRWIDFVYNDDGFHIYHGNATDEEKLLSRTFEALQLEAGEGDKTPMYMDHQCEMDMSMTLSDACSWRSHSPGVLVEGIGRWVDEVQVQVPETLVLSADVDARMADASQCTANSCCQPRITISGVDRGGGLCV